MKVCPGLLWDCFNFYIYICSVRPVQTATRNALECSGFKSQQGENIFLSPHPSRLVPDRATSGVPVDTAAGAWPI